MAGSERKNGRQRGELVAALDLGTSKAACFLAQIDDDGPPSIVGVGHQPGRGMRAGAVIDIEQARDVVINAVHAAERMAGLTVRNAFVALGCGKPGTARVSHTTSLDGREVSAADIRKVLDQEKGRAAPPDRELLHALPLGFRVDGQGGIRDPRGMFGKSLSLDLNVITAEAGPVRTLSTCIAGSHLGIEAFVVSPYAAALACVVEDELQLGTIVIDMGGGTTSLAIFEGGALVHADTVPVGGAHVTQDVVHGLSTPFAHAERLKLLFGSTAPRPGDDREIIDVPQIGDSDNSAPNHMPKSLLSGIIRPRIEETLELVRAKIDHSGVSKAAVRRIVLTGGASQLAGASDMAATLLGRQVRLGRPRRMRGLAEAATGPAFAVVNGLIAYALERHAVGGLADVASLAPTPKPRLRLRQRSRNAALGAAVLEQQSRPGMMRRIGTWFHDHF
jgi:cell division protein FtsA